MGGVYALLLKTQAQTKAAGQFGAAFRQISFFVLVMYLRVHSRNKKITFLDWRLLISFMMLIYHCRLLY
jgi:hypothetical protein